MHCREHPDELQFVLSQLSRKVSSPRVTDVQGLEQLQRHVHGRLYQRLLLEYRRCGELLLATSVDADWAGEPHRKSVSGGIHVSGSMLLGSVADNTEDLPRHQRSHRVRELF